MTNQYNNRRDIWLYIIAWGIALFFATFPKLLLSGDTEFIQNDVTNSYIFPLVMIIVIYLFDTVFVIRSSNLSVKQLQYGFLMTLLFLAGSFIFLLFSIISEILWLKILLFVICWFFISALKWISIDMVREPILQLTKPK